MDKTFNEYLTEYVEKLEQSGVSHEEISKRRYVIQRFLDDKNVKVADKRIKCNEDKTDVISIRKKYDDFVHKYYHNRLVIASYLKDYLKEFYQINNIKLFDNNERVLQLEKELQGNKENKLKDIAEKFCVSEETIKADFKHVSGRNNFNLSDGFFLGEKIQIVNNLVYGKRYYNKKTTTPIFLNLGIGELYAILSALCEKAETSTYSARELLYKNLINKIYIQCSDYGKEIIKEYLSKRNVQCLDLLLDSIKGQMELEQKFSDSWMNLLGTMEKMNKFRFKDINGNIYTSSVKNVKDKYVIAKDKDGNNVKIRKEDIMDVIS